MKKVPFELVLINPGSSGENGSRHPDFLAKNPSGTIPVIEEPDTGFTLGEGHAILAYLANQHGWTDVYPEDLRVRAKIDQYLNYHHRNVRDASIGLITPKIRKDLNIPEVMQESSIRTLTNALHTLNDGWLADSLFLVGDSLTIADLAAYVEIGQLQPEFTNVFDFSPFPNVEGWLDRMKKIDMHDDVHVVLSEMGDISTDAPEMDQIRNANVQALRRLKQVMSEF